MMNDSDSDAVLVHWAFAANFYWPCIGSSECVVQCRYLQVAQKLKGQIEEQLEEKLIAVLLPVLALSEVSYFGSWLLSVSSLLMSCTR